MLCWAWGHHGITATTAGLSLCPCVGYGDIVVSLSLCHMWGHHSVTASIASAGMLWSPLCWVWGHHGGTVPHVGTSQHHCHHSKCRDVTVPLSLCWAWGHHSVTATIAGVGMSLCHHHAGYGDIMVALSLHHMWGHHGDTASTASAGMSLCRCIGHGDIVVSLPPAHVRMSLCHHHCVGCGDIVVSLSPQQVQGCHCAVVPVLGMGTSQCHRPHAVMGSSPCCHCAPWLCVPPPCPPAVRLQPGDVPPPRRQ